MTDEQYKDIRKGIGYLLKSIEVLVDHNRVTNMLLANFFCCKSDNSELDNITTKNVESLCESTVQTSEYYDKVAGEMTKWTDDQQP